ncbi:MAG TPA: cytochrome c biogenesis protein CcsA, partial [Terriglobales bacterium]|nr:cytochrome c biogenesis protein CcsA [Terriglobales bacterium]
MARARAATHPGTRGNTLLVLVTLTVITLLFVAFLGNVKSGNLVNEAGMLYVTLIFYAAATALYLAFGVTGIERYVRFALGATWLGFAANTLAFAHRWWSAGHPPFSSIYEMLLSFVWTLAALTLIVERRFAVRVLGTVTMPLAVVGVILMQLLPSEVRPLVPALQSTWLHVHVTFAMLAYAACAVSFALALMFLIQDRMHTDTFLASSSALVTGLYLGMLTRFAPSGGLRVIAWDASERQEMFLARNVRLFVIIPELGWLFLAVTVAVAAPLALYLWSRFKKDERALTWANGAFY